MPLALSFAASKTGARASTTPATVTATTMTTSVNDSHFRRVSNPIASPPSSSSSSSSSSHQITTSFGGALHSSSSTAAITTSTSLPPPHPPTRPSTTPPGPLPNDSHHPDNHARYNISTPPLTSRVESPYTYDISEDAIFFVDPTTTNANTNVLGSQARQTSPSCSTPLSPISPVLESHTIHNNGYSYEMDNTSAGAITCNVITPPYESTMSPSSSPPPNMNLSNGMAHLTLSPSTRIGLCGVKLDRHPDLWFNDGSVICRAGDTLFRVHMSQLARHSECFRDMFSMPQPRAPGGDTLASRVAGLVHGGNGSGTALGIGAGARMNGSSHVVLPTVDGGSYERIPIVDLHDDPEDVGNLLTALYDGPSFGNNDQDDFRIVSGILRLSTKYIVDSLRTKALAHLSVAWPLTLKGWDLREDLARSCEQEHPEGGHIYPHPISVINLAREVDAPQLLPAAFYDLSRYSYTQIFEPTEDDPLYRPGPLIPRLSGYDMQCLCLGKEAAQHSITSLIQAMGNTSHYSSRQHHHPSTSGSSLGLLSSSTHHGHGLHAPHPHLPTSIASTTSHIRKPSSNGICLSAAACRKDFSELVDLATQHYLFDRERGWCDPLYVAEELGQLKSAEFSECKACARSLEVWAGKERERLWKLVTGWFRLTDGIQGCSMSSFATVKGDTAGDGGVH
ncbi:hypothetical protein BDN72DRAFT_832773 [Pluteus cervinus]|uniref:Uncharacterized protein n=1 Tax=Pluteus cervinus TaxID=181527 RepID=A0ACD3BBV8_9AGAR|nr:hypothetical protein BDN72DRAFT_832773 [Pluteus cervinus]